MPIYEYKCLGCGKIIEKMQKVSDAPLNACEECGGKLEKQWSLSGFQFKGAGWYVTDYSGKKAETKSEAKPESDGKANETSEKKSGGESTAPVKAASNPTKTKDSGSKKD